MRSKRWPLIISALVLVLGLTACGTGGTDAPANDTKQVIRFGDTQFQTLWINNAIAGYAVEHGYGYPVEYVELTTPLYQQSITNGSIDVMMELWQQNIIKWYNESIDAGTLLNLGPTYERSTQGFYVPRYMVEGDAARGIEATAPDLKSVFDLPKYKELFKDPENPSMGVWVNCITGWQCAKINSIKMHAYGMDEHYNTIEPGAAAALDAAIAGAYKRGQPILAYYWEPTWLLGTYDMIQLEEPPYTEQCNDEIQEALTNEIEISDVTENAGCAYEAIPVDKGVYSGLKERAPEVVTFLEKMNVGTDALNQTAAYMEAEGVEADAAAIWYFENFQDVWRSWIPADVATKLEKALIAAGAKL
jgi:glycine betaine/proline transport system substrate-binding protein